MESSVNYRIKDYITFNNALNTSLAMIRFKVICFVTKMIECCESSYARISGFGNIMNKVLTFGVGATYGWKSSRSTLKNKSKIYRRDSAFKSSKY